MMKKISNLLMMALLTIGMGLTSCDEMLDNAVDPGVMPDVDEIVAVTITTAPTATAGNILAGSTTALITVVTADGGTMMYKVTSDNIQPTSTDGFSAEVPTAAALAMGTYFVWYYAEAADAQHSNSEIAATPVEVTVQPGLGTPLTLEVLSEGAGTIVIKSPKVNMKYSKNGETPTTITSTADVTIDVTKGDKIEFYGNGTNITTYNGTKIAGGTAEVKVYGNIMSLVDETGFAKATTLTQTNSFQFLFYENTRLTDASGLLLPAETLTEYCYNQMFYGCTALTAAPAELPAETLAKACYSQMFGNTALTTTPKLPATTLANECYQYMFQYCTSLTTAYVKAAYTASNEKCWNMFTGCTATGGTFYSVDAATADNWRSTFSLSSWSSGVYPTE